MPKKPTVSTLTAGYGSTTLLNNNFDQLRDGFDNTLSLDGSTPNAMSADLDMGGNDVLNALSVNATQLYLGGTRVTSVSATPSWKGAWVTATTYYVDDIVRNSGSSYICVVEHTSGTFSTDLSAVKWELLAQQGAAGAGTGDMLAANDLSDVANVATSRSNLGLGSIATLTAPAGDVVGTTDTQTLSAKTLTSPVINTGVSGTALSSQALAEAGTDNATIMTPLRAKQAIDAFSVIKSYQIFEAVEEYASATSVPYTGGSYNTRNLNTVLINEIAGASLASKRVTLPAGTYIIRCSGTTYTIQGTNLRLYNVTDATPVAYSSTGQTATTGAGSNDTLEVYLTITASKVFEIATDSSSGSLSTGLGVNRTASPRPQRNASFYAVKVA